MDPDTTLALMREAQSEARWDDADAHAADLGEWIDRGGYLPAGISSREVAYALNSGLAVN